MPLDRYDLERLQEEALELSRQDDAESFRTLNMITLVLEEHGCRTTGPVGLRADRETSNSRTALAMID